jgi:hypothetical protein
VTDDLRALLRSELDAERPPPLGDIVGAAMRAGRRKRRNRRIGLAAALAGVLVLATLLNAATPVRDHLVPASDGTRVSQRPSMPRLSPGTVPIMPSAPTAAEPARTVTSHVGTLRAGGKQKKATSAAMLHLLTELLPPGRTSHYGVAAENDLRVQLYLDAGSGPGMLRVTVGRLPAVEASGAPDGQVTVTVAGDAGDCARTTTVTADRSGGTRVRLEIASCLAGDDPSATGATRPALTAEQGARIVIDPRWGVTMDAGLVDAGARRFPAVPVFVS